MQSLASCPHLTQSLDPTHRSVIEPNTTQPPTFAKNTTQLDPVQTNPWMHPATFISNPQYPIGQDSHTAFDTHQGPLASLGNQLRSYFYQLHFDQSFFF